VRREDAGRARREAERRNTIVNELMSEELRLRRGIYRHDRKKGTSVRVSDDRSVSARSWPEPKRGSRDSIPEVVRSDVELFLVFLECLMLGVIEGL
jgi:hypothetical protein